MLPAPMILCISSLVQKLFFVIAFNSLQTVLGPVLGPIWDVSVGLPHAGMGIHAAFCAMFSQTFKTWAIYFQGNV